MYNNNKFFEKNIVDNILLQLNVLPDFIFDVDELLLIDEWSAIPYIFDLARSYSDDYNEKGLILFFF